MDSPQQTLPESQEPLEPGASPRYIDEDRRLGFVRSLRIPHAPKWLALTIGAGLAIAPAVAVAKGELAKRPAPISLSFDRISAFTPADADPRLAAAFAGRAPSAADFKFTPSAAKGRPSQLRVAIRARADNSAAIRSADTSPAVTALTPASYNLGVAVGWRRFAVTGDVAKTKGGNPALGERETAVVGVNYSLKRFTGRVAVGADRTEKAQAPSLVRGDSYSVDVGGAYNITRNLAVTGGVRYKMEQDRLSTLNDERSDSKAVYVGTAFRF